MKVKSEDLTKSRLLLFASILAMSVAIFSFHGRKNVRKSKELERFVETYKYVPFNIPRNGDGVGTIVTFKRKTESVIAAPGECLDLELLTIDTLEGSLPDFDYTLSKENNLEFNSGKVFGNEVNLIAALNNESVDSVRVRFEDVFEIRTSRISVERQISEMEKLCQKRILHKKNYVIERVLGVGSISIAFLNKSGKEISLTGSLMDEIKLKAEIKRKFEGQNILAFEEPRLIGYRIWDVGLKLGFAEKSYSADSVDIEKTIQLKLE